MPDKGAGKQKRVDLGASGSVTFCLSANQRRLLIAFDTQTECNLLIGRAGRERVGVRQLSMRRLSEARSSNLTTRPCTCTRPSCWKRENIRLTVSSFRPR